MPLLDSALLVLAIAAPLIGLGVGLVVGVQREAIARAAARGVSVGLLGPLAYALWRVYLYVTRHDPVTGYVGLHRVSILMLSLVIFAVVGGAVGYGLRRLFPPSSQSR